MTVVRQKPRHRPVQSRARQVAPGGLSSEKERKKVIAYMMFLAKRRIV